VSYQAAVLDKAGDAEYKQVQTRMAHIPDLSTCGYLPASDGLSFVAIGWLEAGQDFAQGNVSEEFFARLCALLQQPWQPPVACGGIHPCTLCRFSVGRAQSSIKNYFFDGVGRGFLFVPSGETLFISPTSVAHYIDAHGYFPPVEFQQAIVNCPEMPSQEYMRALLATPVVEWLRRLRVAS
jgi:hypothetical protein